MFGFKIPKYYELLDIMHQLLYAHQWKPNVPETRTVYKSPEAIHYKNAIRKIRFQNKFLDNGKELRSV